MASEINLEATMEVRTTFRGTAASKKGFGVVLLAVIVAMAAMLQAFRSAGDRDRHLRRVGGARRP
jgi:hypothetical protein